MNLEETIKVNKQIMKLIKSKYPREFPTRCPGPDYTYYSLLKKDVEDAERHLKLAEKQ